MQRHSEASGAPRLTLRGCLPARLTLRGCLPAHALAAAAAATAAAAPGPGHPAPPSPCSVARVAQVLQEGRNYGALAGLPDVLQSVLGKQLLALEGLLTDLHAVL